MDIGNINIVGGGQNAMDKSTSSKLLYCFLKYCLTNRQNEAYESVIEQIKGLFFMMRRMYRPRGDFDSLNFIKNHL